MCAQGVEQWAEHTYLGGLGGVRRKEEVCLPTLTLRVQFIKKSTTHLYRVLLNPR